MPCPKCGFHNPGAFSFCGRCGALINPNSASRHTDDHHSSRAERRQLTVVFCDLVGSTALSGQVDPEELNDLTSEYQRVCSEVIRRHEGRIARFVGDGILVYFGYPLSHENDAQRAVRSALDIVAAISALGESLGKSLHVRVAVHTGLVVVGQLGGRANSDPMAISGETPNVAARLQALAEPDMVVTSAATHRLIQGFFLSRSLGTHTLKGVATPIDVYEILEPTGIETRFERAVASGLTPFVGREEEVSLLLERWEQTKALGGKVVMLRGEAGIGKSRLVRALIERTAGEPRWELSSRCSPYYQNSVLYPAIECLQRILRYDRNDDALTKFEKLEQLLNQFAFGLTETLPLFASLLSLPPNDRFPALPMSAQRQRQKTFEAIVELLIRVAEKGPIRLVVEDLHWADSSTLDLIDLLIERLPHASLLLILPFRSEFVSPWPSQAHITELTLGRFSRAATERMIQAFACGKPLPIEVVEEIVEKTEGVPLFVEELTRMVLESPFLRERDGRYVLTSALPSLAIPTTLYDSLMTRLDRLGTAKDVAQLAATIGRDFSYELLRAVSPLDETILTGALNRLVDAELLRQDVVQNRLRYTFRHALIRDAAYESTLKTRRRQCHIRIAKALEERFPEVRDSQPELVAHHYTLAGVPEMAIRWWQAAGELAAARSANHEAIGHLKKARELLAEQAETPERDRGELALQLALGAAQIATRGYAAPEVEMAYARARELCDRVSDTRGMFPALRGLTAFYQVRGELKKARALAEELSVTAHRQDAVWRVGAHLELGSTLFFLGEFVPALAEFEQGARLHDVECHGRQALVLGQDPGVSCVAWGAAVLALLGYPNQALRRAGHALTLAESLGHAHTIAYALHFLALVHELRGDVAGTADISARLIQLATHHGFALWIPAGTALHAWARGQRGERGEGIQPLKSVLASWRAAGAEISRPHFLALLAETYQQTGEFGEGLRAVDEGLEVGRRTGDRWRESHLLRLRGELVAASSPASESALAEAEVWFQRAIDTARTQNARLFETKAARRLSDRWRHRGLTREAAQLDAEMVIPSALETEP